MKKNTENNQLEKVWVKSYVKYKDILKWKLKYTLLNLIWTPEDDTKLIAHF